MKDPNRVWESLMSYSPFKSAVRDADGFEDLKDRMRDVRKRKWKDVEERRVLSSLAADRLSGSDKAKEFITDNVKDAIKRLKDIGALRGFEYDEGLDSETLDREIDGAVTKLRAEYKANFLGMINKLKTEKSLLDLKDKIDDKFDVTSDLQRSIARRIDEISKEKKKEVVPTVIRRPRIPKSPRIPKAAELIPEVGRTEIRKRRRELLERAEREIGDSGEFYNRALKDYMKERNIRRSLTGREILAALKIKWDELQ